jgi:hypothetical protein
LSDRKVNQSEGEDLGRRYSVPVQGRRDLSSVVCVHSLFAFETEISAKTNANVDTLMECLVREHLKKKRRREKELQALQGAMRSVVGLMLLTA